MLSGGRVMTKVFAFLILGLFTSFVHSIENYKCDESTCRDTTVSHNYDGNWETSYEGKCGQVALANLMSMACKESISPEYLEWLSWDISPGTRPSTLKSIVKKVLKSDKFDGCDEIKNYRLKHETIKFQSSEAFTQSQYINRLHDLVRYRIDDQLLTTRVRRTTTIRKDIPNEVLASLLAEDRYVTNEEVISEINPVISCISSNGGGHYVTIVDVTNIFDKYGGCEVVYNHWGRQYRENCMDFAKKGSMKGGVYSTVSSWFCGKYSIFHLE